MANSMNHVTKINDDELLYRSVRADPSYDEYFYDDDNNLVILPNAFKDGHKRPSVSRAGMDGVDPCIYPYRLSETDGIVGLIAGEIRAINDVTSQLENKKLVYKVDIEHKPSKKNKAHAQIFAIPKFQGKPEEKEGAFDRLKISLANLASKRNWIVEPVLPSEIQTTL